MRRGRGKSPAAGGRPPGLLRHPVRVLLVAAIPVIVLAVLGLGLDSRLSPSSLDIPGTSAEHANALLREYFGPSQPFPILLQGPAGALDRQGPELVRALRRDPRVTTLSPWDRGSVQRLRPSPRRALIIANFHVDTATAVKQSVPELNRTLAATIRSPVRATQTGYATISRAIQEESIASSERSELIALPILLLVLLLVFRSPVAAAVPLGLGAVTVLTSRGLLWVLTHWFTVDALSLTVCTMMGLALGVDYALLMVSRFREELRRGGTPAEAALRTRHTAGRTTAFAGTTLVLSMIVAFFVVPGALLASLAATLALVVVLSVVVATVVVPAVLTLLGPNVDRWHFSRSPGERSRLMVFVGAALRRPVPVAIAIGAVLLLLAAPALALKTGPLSPGQLPAGDPVRRDYERITKAAGSGFEAPFQIVVAAHEGAITDPGRLAKLQRWQRRIASLPGVEAVAGPGQIAKAVAPLREGGRRLLEPGKQKGPLGSLAQLGRGLNRATAGVAALRAGLSRAGAGAGLLAEGSGRAAVGARLLARGLARAKAGTENALGGLGAFAAGSRRLIKAEYQAAYGAKRLTIGIAELPPNLRSFAAAEGKRTEKSLDEAVRQTVPSQEERSALASERLAAVLGDLEAMTVGKADPHYAETLKAAGEAATAVSGSEGSASLAGESAALRAGLEQDLKEVRLETYWVSSTIENLKLLNQGGTELREGLYKLARETKGKLGGVAATVARKAAALTSGLSRLEGGARRLFGGISRLERGAQALEAGLADGFHRAYPLQSGLDRAAVQVVSSDRHLEADRARLRHNSPGLFDSGYFVLSALQGSPRPRREQAEGAVDLERGGQAASILVFSRFDLNSPGSIALNHKLDEDAAAIGRSTGASAGVAGGPATLNTYSRVARARIPMVVAAITLATFLMLVVVLRALPLAALAVLLNLATVGVAFGILTLLTYVPQGFPLGGRHYIDAIGATLIFGVVFGLSIDYAVFLLLRMREHRDGGAGHAEAIRFGLDKTAGVITGAAAIMMAVFVAFAGSSIATVSQLGVGLTIAVLLDATVVRIVLLPALMLLIGERVWWLPKPLERLLPEVRV
ncbi:MAG: efflux RND transporter permease subunit [Solirubrobacterales bacterium]